MELINFQDNVTKCNAETMNYAFQLMHPVGSIYMTTVSTNPHDVFGFGTWELWGAGRVPVGIDTNDTDFNTVEKTGGSKELQEHSHYITSGYAGSGTSEDALLFQNGLTLSYAYMKTQNAGSGTSGNLQPYITCYMWKRTE